MNTSELAASLLALLPDESDMVEHNPDEGPRMFCCGAERVYSLGSGYGAKHLQGCWYVAMRDTLKGEAC